MAAATRLIDSKMLILVLVLAVTLNTVRRAEGAVKGVTASLHAKWPATPLLLEASEFIAEENSDKFWPFVETVQELTVYTKVDTERSYYNLILKKAGQFLSELQVKLLKFSLSIRAYSPTVQMFHQVASDVPPPDGCSAFVVIHGERTCSIKEIKQLLKEAGSRPEPYLYKGDHKFPSLKQGVPVVILYAELGTKEFVTFHKVLLEKTQNGEIHYVLRHFIQNPSSRKMHLSGYGVELAIKSTEYRAVDDSRVKGINNTEFEADDETDTQGFLFKKLIEQHPDLTDNLKELRQHLIESTDEMTPLKVWELQDLSFQAAARITSSPPYDALKIMKDFSQNFPVKARSLTRTAVNPEMKKEIEENQKYIKETFGSQPGDAALFINGRLIDLDVHNPFSILDILREEGKVMQGLYDIGIREENLSAMLRLNLHSSDKSFAVDIRHSAILWINDIEKDYNYQSWHSSYQELLKPMFPGVIRQIRRNFFNLVLFINPEQDGMPEFVKLAQLFYLHNIPLRIGFVFVVNDEDVVDGNTDTGVALVRVFNFITEKSGSSHAFIIISDIFSKIQNGEMLTVEHIVNSLRIHYPHADLQSILGPNSEYDHQRKAGATFYKKTGLGPLPQALFNGVPFNSNEMDPEELETVILQRIMDTTGFFQRAVFAGHLKERMNVVDFLMEQSNVVPRINPTILGMAKRYLDLTFKSVSPDWYDLTIFPYLDPKDKTAVVTENMKYLSKQGENVIYTATIWIVADFDKPAGRQLLSSALKHMETGDSIRVGVVNNPTETPTEESSAVSRGIWAALLTHQGETTLSFIKKLILEDTVTSIASGNKIKEMAIQGMDTDTFEKKYNTIGVDFLRVHEFFCQDVIKLLPGQMTVISNGRILGPFDENEDFYPEDFHLLEKVTLSSSSEKVKETIDQMDMNVKRDSDLIMKVAALLSLMPKGEKRLNIKFPKDELSVVKLPPLMDEPYYEVTAVVDPITRGAQKMAPFLMVLGQLFNVKLQMFMNCQSKLSDMPLKSFYRYILEPEITFMQNNSLSPGPVAKFLGIPEGLLLTLNMITPDSWLVEAVESSYDLDNIHLQDVEGIVTAKYELEYLLLEGHCFDITTGQPPRGLQFNLGTKNDPVMVDTIVMANLGYFQLKANPGAWILHLREGRSDDIYQIAHHEGTDSTDNVEDVVVVLNSFKSKIIKVQVQKRPDKIQEDLLSEGSSENIGIWDSLVSFTGQGKSEEKSKMKDDVLNIFSVASGHLYERFLRIMMLSVLRNTKTPVKFWFLKNYLSPTFKEIIPHMAKEYGFQYELVQYRWPRWLHQQTEKQRIIWGYKILFLDVLFPLAVDKIIFVDADQIVRADLKELRDLDLEGAPYGYTPFCDSRTEMDGYRFWKAGYWASHLGHRKYHISALYVVDLKKFRKIAAGDRLRGQYQALSQDPNSLSNLDQDLPNNMIHQVPIKSLPQEWLWCETWCDDQSKKRAKTIDLCNNPKTKEPKLEAAVRIVPEWVEYDSELKQFLKEDEEQERNITEPSVDTAFKRDEL
ncbi:UDP-glucose:glycoprotein glucosyltransferase 2 isoform X2 [Protopterus annectens]|uniref:UDP-glucose:glycoprotein glucosyltransferase 2 isoform X2 n=1 Tax=Protopterus annectens TaxID=7888 RepID=UPI001CF93CA1|nr:UDP-glucose:glycoprotein glucosyltransferase 2 isoform X2 [Protopterus annectens]